MPEIGTRNIDETVPHALPISEKIFPRPQILTAPLAGPVFRPESCSASLIPRRPALDVHVLVMEEKKLVPVGKDDVTLQGGDIPPGLIMWVVSTSEGSKMFSLLI